MDVMGIDHVQIAAPTGCEEAARSFFADLLGLCEIEKPSALQARGGVWFSLGAQQLHVGILEPFSPATKAHPALRVAPGRLQVLADRLSSAGATVMWDEAVREVRRFHTEDPWGNRLELVSSGVGQEDQVEDDVALQALFDEMRNHLAVGRRGGAGHADAGSPLLVLRSVRYWSQADETAFFGWLDQLDCVAGYRGQGMDLLVSLKPDAIDAEAVHDLVALFKRYGITKAPEPLVAGLAFDHQLAEEGGRWDLRLSDAGPSGESPDV